MKDKVVLFNGENMDGFVCLSTGGKADWEVKDGVMTVIPWNKDIRSEYEYGDAHLHVEFKLPYMPEAEGQNRGNSGVYVQGIYEVQVLDSYGKETPADDDCGALYSLAAPLTNACAAPEEWQTYDIFIRAARLNDDGSVREAAIITVILNGVVIHNNYTLPSKTPGGAYNTIVERGPLVLQDHKCPVSFRNIWVQPLD